MAVKWTVEIEIADVWIADGFRLDAVELADALDSELLGGFAQEGEIICRVVKEPTQAAINQAINRHDAEPGYLSVNAPGVNYEKKIICDAHGDDECPACTGAGLF